MRWLKEEVPMPRWWILTLAVGLVLNGVASWVR